MQVTQEPKAYTKNIENKLIDYFIAANSSIQIAMAWFTNDNIKDNLILLKKRKPEISIQIVVDDNSINDKYFSNYTEKFRQANVEIKEKINSTFLHHKFAVIDSEITITGSYNYTKKANKNLENIVILHSKFISSFYSRIFKFLTTKNYFDENIELLFEYPDFAQSILSTYYNFSKVEYNRYKNKIVLGGCFTHENGLYDEIKYYPGFIFNPKITYRKVVEKKEFDFDLDYTEEFPLPVSKDTIKYWTESRNHNLILDYYNGKEDEYHLINDELDMSSVKVELYFKHKFEHTYTKDEMKSLIERKVDIIIENDLWGNNFEPFIDKNIVQKIFSKIQLIDNENWW